MEGIEERAGRGRQTMVWLADQSNCPVHLSMIDGHRFKRAQLVQFQKLRMAGWQCPTPLLPSLSQLTYM